MHPRTQVPHAEAVVWDRVSACGRIRAQDTDEAERKEEFRRALWRMEATLSLMGWVQSR